MSKLVLKNFLIFGGLLLVLGVAIYDSPLHRALILTGVGASLFGNFWDKFFRGGA